MSAMFGILRRVLGGLARIAAAVVALLFARRRERRETERELPPPEDDPLASNVVLALLAGSSLAFAGFAASYVLELGTQMLGGCLALGFGLAAAASIISAKRLVPQEELEEDAGEFDHDEAREATAEIVHEGGRGITRRRLLYAAAGGTGAVAAGSLLVPAASLGPLLDTERLREAPWERGRRLVDADGAPIVADMIDVGSFVTAFAVGADPKALDASVIVVRVAEDEIDLPPERLDWAPEGLLAYSKICTHAGCAVSLFDYPSHPPTQPRPRLVCPCHYSAFDAGAGGAVLAGPAGRPLPQLPLEILSDRGLAAAGPLAGPPGPSWGGVRE